MAAAPLPAAMSSPECAVKALRSTRKQTENTGKKRRAMRTHLGILPRREANGDGVVLGEAAVMAAPLGLA